jgi:hypothetical protein
MMKATMMTANGRSPSTPASPNSLPTPSVSNWLKVIVFSGDGLSRRVNQHSQRLASWNIGRLRVNLNRWRSKQM